MFHGDELSFEFSADDLSPPAPGMKRSFMLYANGFGKDSGFSLGLLADGRTPSLSRYVILSLPTGGERYPQSEAHSPNTSRPTTRAASKVL